MKEKSQKKKKKSKIKKYIAQIGSPDDPRPSSLYLFAYSMLIIVVGFFITHFLIWFCVDFALPPFRAFLERHYGFIVPSYNVVMLQGDNDGYDTEQYRNNEKADKISYPLKGGGGQGYANLDGVCSNDVSLVNFFSVKFYHL